MAIFGVAGHRFLADIDKIEKGVGQALDRIVATFPGESLKVVSSLAEGVDRIVVHLALARPRAELTAVLPLPRSDYIKDFERDESKREFQALLERASQIVELPIAGTREEAYEAAGRYMLDHCDMLVVVWDGHNAQGQGGTGDLVSEARRRGLPVAWVHAGNKRSGTNEPTTLSEDQGKVSFERFPHRKTPTEGKRGE
jgi:hypothetical protein